MATSPQIAVILAPMGITLTGQKRPEGMPMNGHGGDSIELSLLKGEAFSMMIDTGSSVWVIPANLAKPEILITGSTYKYLKQILSNF